MDKEPLDTFHKALALNMDQSTYGTIAEIGAGQETARWFFKVGRAASTIAKTMSAYDMQFSDSIYGSCERYVSRERLQSMLDKEYKLVIERLNEKRGSESSFYAFANTVSTYSYKQQKNGHGWLGIRFQTQPDAGASQIILHVVLKGVSGAIDQNTLGVLGVNIIYAAYFFHANPAILLSSLMDNLGAELLDIDMVDFSGPAFEDVDNRLMALYLVKSGLSPAAIFNATGKLVQPSDALYKKSVLVERSRFRPPTLLTMNILDSAYETFIKEPEVSATDVYVLSEMTLQNLTDGDDVNENDFLERVDILCSLGKNVMISNFGQFYKLAQYLYTQTNLPIAIALGITNLINIFDEKYYDHLHGGILESFGLLFRNDLRLYVCPQRNHQNSAITTVTNLKVQRHLRHLYHHLLENRYIRDLNHINYEYLSIQSEVVFEKIQNDNDSWKEMVPDLVYSTIRDRGLFKDRDRN